MDNVKKGRIVVIVLISIMLVLDLVSIVTTFSATAAHGKKEMAMLSLKQGGFRFLLTGLMLYFLYKGYRWAKWLMVVLLSLGGIIGLFITFAQFNLITLVLGIIYIFFVIMLIGSKNVNNFFLYQRGLYTPAPLKQ